MAILDADKEGFLRSETSLVQTIGRTARNVNAKVLLYGDKVTNSMKKAIDETQRRRTIQLEYNAKHGITPETIKKEIRHGLKVEFEARKTAQHAVNLSDDEYDKAELASQIEKEMLAAAAELDFERAGFLKKQLVELQEVPEIN